MRSLAAVALLIALTPLAVAQRTSTGAPTHVAPARPAVPRFNLPNGSFAFGRGAHPSSGFRRRSSPSPYASLPFPFFGDAFNPDDIYSTGYPVASQPPAFLLQLARDMAGAGADSMGPSMSAYNPREPSSSQPLLIELQGGRYVKVNTTAVDGEALPLNQPENAQPAKSTRGHSTRSVMPGPAPGPMIAAASATYDLPPAVLVFRDGHLEEVRDYTIADGSLYARGDYYRDGYWNKKIDLSSLNLTETLQANMNRNVKFVLPSSPNEVIARF
jgi:hypothetical protein